MSITKEDKFIDFVLEHVDNKLLQLAEEGRYYFEDELAESELENILKEEILSISESEELTDELAESFIAAKEIAKLYLEEIKEACDEESDDYDDSDDEKSDEDDVNENIPNKHKISKMQSIIDARKRRTDPNVIRSRKRTLMKRAARGDRVVNKKLSRSLKKTFSKGFGKRWEDDEEPKDIDTKKVNDSDEEDETITPNKEEMKAELAKKLAKKAEACKESISDSIEYALNESELFGSLNEDESASLREFVKKHLLESADKQVEFISKHLLEATDEYVEQELIPSMNEHVEEYINEEVIPEIKKDVDEYISYVAEDVSESLHKQNLIVKSKSSVQLESFRDKLLTLISEELNIIPEQEDIVHKLESKLTEANEMIQSERIKKIEYRNQIEESEKAIYLLKRFSEFNISEATRERIINKLDENDISENEYRSGYSLDEFKSATDALIKESMAESEKEPAENKKINETKEDENPLNDILKRSLDLLKK